MASQMPEYSGGRANFAGVPNVEMGAQAPLEAFGGGESAAQVGQAIQNVGNTAENIEMRAKMQADQLAFMSADRKLSDLQTQIGVNTSKMLGKDALQAPAYAQQQWSDGVKEIQKGISNQAQAMAFGRSASSRWGELNRTIQYHVSGQIQQLQDNETSSYLASSRTAAVANAQDDQQVQTELGRQTAVLNDWAARKGIDKDSPIYQEKLQSQLSGTVSAVIAARLDQDNPNNVQQAQAFYAANKDKMTAQDLVTVKRSIDQAETSHMGIQLWNKVQNWKLPDGSPDYARMQNEVFNNPNLSDDRKQELDQFLHAKVREATLEKYQEDAGRERSFADAVIKARQNGAPMEDAQKLVNQYGTDAYDQAQKTAFVRQTYAPPTNSDPNTFNDLSQQIHSGTDVRDQINKAFQSGTINAKDYRTLSEQNYASAIQGKNPEMEETMKRVQTLAQSSLPNKQDQANFMYVIRSQSQGQSSDDVWKMANDKLKNVPGTGFLGFGQTPQWKADLNKIDSSSLAWGKLNQDVGSDQIKAIGAGTLYKGADKWGPQDVDAFAAQFGGYDAIKRGTPVNNAIQSLSRAGQLVTPENVKALLKVHSDGNYSGSFQ